MYIYLKDHAKHNRKKGDIVKTIHKHYAKRFLEEGVIAECDADGKPIEKEKKGKK